MNALAQAEAVLEAAQRPQDAPERAFSVLWASWYLAGVLAGTVGLVWAYYIWKAGRP